MEQRGSDDKCLARVHVAFEVWWFIRRWQFFLVPFLRPTLVVWTFVIFSFLINCIFCLFESKVDSVWRQFGTNLSNKLDLKMRAACSLKLQANTLVCVLFKHSDKQILYIINCLIYYTFTCSNSVLTTLFFPIAEDRQVSSVIRNRFIRN